MLRKDGITLSKNISYILGKVKNKKTSSWLVSVIQYLKYNDYINLLEIINVKMKEVKYTTIQKLVTIVCSILIDCEYTKDINTKLIPDTVAASLLEMETFPEQSQINILLRRFSDENIDELKEVHNKIFKQDSLSISEAGDIVVDIDQSGLIANGKTYELSKKGYFPKKRNSKGYQVSAAYSSNTGETVGLYLDSGNTVSIKRLQDLINDTLNVFEEKQKKNIVFRVDSGYCSDAGVEMLIESGAKFLTKVYSSNRAKKIGETIQFSKWYNITESISIYEIDDNTGIRKILVRTYTKKGYKYTYLITNIYDKTDLELFNYYNERQTIEAFFKICKNTYHIRNLRTRAFNGIYGFLWLVFLSHNIITLMKKTVFSDTEIEDLGIKEIISRFGDLEADVIEEGNTIKLVLPPLKKLSKQLIDAINPKYKQISIDMLNNPFLSS